MHINLYHKLYFISSLLIGLFLLGCTESTPEQEALEKSMDGKKLPSFREVPSFIGVYQDTLPCTDCLGALTQLDLKSDSTYKKSIVFLGKGSAIENSTSTTGKWHFDESSGVVWLDSLKEKGEIGFAVLGDSLLHMVGSNGKIIPSNQYRLQKL